MTKDEIYEIAKQSDLGFLLRENWMMQENIETFANLIATHVTRELAKECAGFGEWTAVHIIESVRWE